MPNDRGVPRSWLVAGFVLAAAVGVGRSANTSEPCCFTNERYTGVCEVMPTRDDTCASILGYLNNPATTGKGYCNNTAIRGGWLQKECGGQRTTRTP